MNALADGLKFVWDGDLDDDFQWMQLLKGRNGKHRTVTARLNRLEMLDLAATLEDSHLERKAYFDLEQEMENA